MKGECYFMPQVSSLSGSTHVVEVQIQSKNNSDPEMSPLTTFTVDETKKNVGKMLWGTLFSSFMKLKMLYFKCQAIKS